MSESLENSTHALMRVVQDELERAKANSNHGSIRISCNSKFLTNGVKYASIQIQCNAGCGWLVEDTGFQADVLERKAIAIKTLLRSSDNESRVSISEILPLVFPEFIIGKNPVKM